MSTKLKHAMTCTFTAAILVLSMGVASAKRSPSWHERGPIAPIVKRAAPPAICTAPAEITRLDYSLPRVAQKVLARQPLTIVAIGSSSTFGVGASSPQMSYPSRLAVELQTLFPNSPVTVLNRGVNGETTVDMLARFDRDVFAAKPDLVIWQDGSNSVLAGLRIGPTATMIRDGLARLKADGVDVIMIDPQYAPAILDSGPGATVDMMARTAKGASVNLFRRFAVMRHWRLTANMPFSSFMSKDELHMNDWSYGCIAKLLAGAINDVTKRQTLTSELQPQTP